MVFLMKGPWLWLRYILFGCCTLIAACRLADKDVSSDQYSSESGLQRESQKNGVHPMSWGQLNAEIIEPLAGPAKASVIWLHGLGASGDDFVPLVPHLRTLNADLNNTRFIFPHAPRIPVTINGGMVMPAWYDLTAIQPKRSVDMASLMASVGVVQQLIRQEMAKGVPSSQILLAGFSQGGAVAYQAGLTFEYPLAGILALSTYLIESDALTIHRANAAVDVLVMHGTQDDVVGVGLGRQSKGWLQQQGVPVEMKEYPMAHQVIAEQLEPMARWMKARL